MVDLLLKKTTIRIRALSEQTLVKTLLGMISVRNVSILLARMIYGVFKSLFMELSFLSSLWYLWIPIAL